MERKDSIFESVSTLKRLDLAFLNSDGIFKQVHDRCNFTYLDLVPVERTSLLRA